MVEFLQDPPLSSAFSQYRDARDLTRLFAESQRRPEFQLAEGNQFSRVIDVIAKEIANFLAPNGSLIFDVYRDVPLRISRISAGFFNSFTVKKEVDSYDNVREREHDYGYR